MGAPFYLQHLFSLFTQRSEPWQHDLTTSTAVMGRQVSPDASLLHTQPLRTPSTASSTSLACHRDRLETLHRADAPHRSRSAHDSRVVANGVGPKPCDQGAEEHEMAKKMPVAVATFRCGAHGMQMLATCSRAYCWPLCSWQACS